MSIENENTNPGDELRRLVLGESLAEPKDFDDLDILALEALKYSEHARIHVMSYSSEAGFFEINVTEEPNGSSGVIFSMHAGDTDDPYLALFYDGNNTLDSVIQSGNRSTDENTFFATCILRELIDDEKLDELERAVASRVLGFANIGNDTIQLTEVESGLHIVDAARLLAHDKANAIQHVNEISGELSEGRELTITGTRYEPINGSAPWPAEEQYPPLQINLRDNPNGLLIYYLSLATGERVCDTKSTSDDNNDIGSSELYVSEDDDVIGVKADDIVAVALNGVCSETLEVISTAVAELCIKIELDDLS